MKISIQKMNLRNNKARLDISGAPCTTNNIRRLIDILGFDRIITHVWLLDTDSSLPSKTEEAELNYRIYPIRWTNQQVDFVLMSNSDEIAYLLDIVCNGSAEGVACIGIDSDLEWDDYWSISHSSFWRLIQSDKSSALFTVDFHENCITILFAKECLDAKQIAKRVKEELSTSDC